MKHAMRIKYRQLEVFSALMESGSVSGAAELLSLSQPAISIALSNLEEEVGFRLFHRTKGFFAPTPEATLLHIEVEKGLLAFSRVERCAGDIADGTVGSITIASNGAAGINLLPKRIADFHQQHPGINIDLKIRSSRKVATWVSGRHVDIGLIDAPVPVEGLKAEQFKFPCVCVMRDTDDLTKHSAITPDLLEGRVIIGVTGDHEIDKELDSLLAESGVTADRSITGSYFAIIRNMVREGAGIAIIDALNGRMELPDHVVWREFQPNIHFKLALLTPTGSESSKPVNLFLDQLRARLAAAL
jgi:DNA-binding transcriptional LysR family regulator